METESVNGSAESNLSPEDKSRVEAEEKMAMRRLEERAAMSQALADSIKGTKVNPEVAIANLAMGVVELQRDFIGLEKGLAQIVQHFNQQMANIQTFMNQFQQAQQGLTSRPSGPALVPKNPIGPSSADQVPTSPTAA